MKPLTGVFGWQVTYLVSHIKIESKKNLTLFPQQPTFAPHNLVYRTPQEKKNPI